MAGSSYVVFEPKENNSPIKLSDIADGNGGYVIIGKQKVAGSYSVSSAGDVNGDGLDDLIISAHGADPNGKNGWRVICHLWTKGTKQPVSLSKIAYGNGGFVINGEAETDFSGYSIGSAGGVVAMVFPI